MDTGVEVFMTSNFLNQKNLLFCRNFSLPLKKIVENLQKAGHRVVFIRLPHMEGYYDFDRKNLK